MFSPVFERNESFSFLDSDDQYHSMPSTPFGLDWTKVLRVLTSPENKLLAYLQTKQILIFNFFLCIEVPLAQALVDISFELLL